MNPQRSKSENAQQVGSMKIYQREEEYIPGQVIKGQVILTLSQEMLCSQIILRFKSSEQITFQNIQYKPTIFLNKHASIIQINSRLKEGEHIFEFQYSLPPILGPSTNANNNELGKNKEVMFTLMNFMIGELNFEDYNILNISVMNVIRIVTKNDQKIIFYDSPSQNIRGFFCQDYGKLNLNIMIRQDEFNPGSNISLALVLTNETKLHLKVFKYELMREYEFKGEKLKNKKKQQQSIGKQYHSIALPPNKPTDNLRLNLLIPSSSTAIPSLEGNTFSCKYFLQFTFFYKTPFFEKIEIIKRVPIKIISETDRIVPIIQLSD